jgi:hypothetical protein
LGSIAAPEFRQDRKRVKKCAVGADTRPIVRALRIRLTYAELIPSTYSGQALRGIKTDFGELSRVAEVRSRAGIPTRNSALGGDRIVGERFYIRATKKNRDQ